MASCVVSFSLKLWAYALKNSVSVYNVHFSKYVIKCTEQDGFGGNSVHIYFWGTPVLVSATLPAEASRGFISIAT
jgi:hypothetical protein